MDYFPLALASGGAFCNRKQEQQDLLHNLRESRPTLLISPRRYGKTSLALHTIALSKLHYAHFDFLSAVDIDDIEKIILKGVGKLFAQIEKGPRKALQIAMDLFAGLNIKFSFDAFGVAIEINNKTVDPAKNILNILERIEKLSETYGKKIVLLFDEFQRVYQISENQAIESVIRQIAQASKRLSFIFSGSNRHLLHKMFNDRDRPFYKLCDRITLERISKQDYTSYINNVAQKTSRSLDAGAIDRILDHTEQHPYYMNLLCSRLWKSKIIKVTDVDDAWSHYVLEERSQVANELDLLSNAQRKLLVSLSRYDGTNAPRGKEFQMQSGMPGATIAQALQFLEKKDYVYQDANKFYKVLDPIIKCVLANG